MASKMKPLISDSGFPHSFLKRDYILIDKIEFLPYQEDVVVVNYNLICLNENVTTASTNAVVSILTHGIINIQTSGNNFLLSIESYAELKKTKQIGFKKLIDFQKKIPKIKNKHRRSVKIAKLEKTLTTKRCAKENKIELKKLKKEYIALNKLEANLFTVKQIKEQQEVFKLIHNEYKKWYHKNKITLPHDGNEYMVTWGGTKTEFINYVENNYKLDLAKIPNVREFKSFRSCLNRYIDNIRFIPKWSFKSAIELYKEYKKRNSFIK